MTGPAGPSPAAPAPPAGAAIDWSVPWFAPWAPLGPVVQRDWQTVDLPTALNAPSAPSALSACGAPVRFVPQAHLPDGTAYEAHIAATGTVPTRDNLHDFFNGLVWHRFPRSKQRLNRLQAAEIARAGVGAVRGPLRDALTLFDENTALLQAPPALWAALRARDWPALFTGVGRSAWASARLVLFGHALLEKLVSPYKSVTAHVFVWPVPDALGQDLAAWDAALAEALTPETLARKPFTPLPVLGVPGWWPANAEPAFYDDPGVFRAPRPRGS